MKFMNKWCKSKYYVHSQDRFLSGTDGCKYEDWKDKSDDFSFAIHPNSEK